MLRPTLWLDWLIACLLYIMYLVGTRKRQKNKKRNSPIIVLLYFKQYSVRFQGSTYQKLFFLTTLTPVVIYGASTHLHVSWILKCGYINQIRFSLLEAMITMIMITPRLASLLALVFSYTAIYLFCTSFFWIKIYSVFCAIPMVTLLN